MMLSTHLTLFLLTMSLIPEINISYELQDTIHTLREENAYLQNKLKNLTQALQDMRKLMLDHSHGKNECIYVKHICVIHILLFPIHFMNLILLKIYLTIWRVVKESVMLFFVNSKESAVEGDQLHAWNEWIQNGNKYYAYKFCLLDYKLLLY